MVFRKVTGRILPGFILAVFAIFLSGKADGQVQLELLRSCQQPKIDLRLQTLLEQKDPRERINVWIFFTDKGFFEEQTCRMALYGRSTALNPYARVRRLKVKRPEELVDFTDLPLCQSYLDEVLDTGVQLRTRSRWLNAVSVRANGQQIGRLCELPFVCWLRLVVGGSRRRLEFQPVEAQRPDGGQAFPIDYGPSHVQLQQIAVPQFHQWLEEQGQGSPGDGVRVCLLDTGFDLAHEALQHIDVIGQWDFIDGDSVVIDEPGDPPGQDTHGTVVLSVIGGYCPGRLIGPAYGASFLLAKTEDTTDEQPIEEDYWVVGIEWAESLGADVVSSSLGYMDWYSYEDMNGNTAITTIAADFAVSQGMVVVSAAGNEAGTSWRYIIAPADGDQVIAVGAVDTTGIRASFSSIGPTSDGRTKPNVMACGSGTYVASAENPSGYYRSFGTSLSTPLVAGVTALLLQADSTLTPDQIRQVLQTTASRAYSPDNFYGWGIVNADAARRGAMPQPPVFADIGNYPNPFSDGTTFCFQVSGSGPVKVSIFTLAGEFVREISDFWDQGSRCEVYWDARNASGQQVADGIYLYQADNGHQILIGKMVCLRAR